MALYIVPSPIGNLADITYRAVDILKKVDIIFCEDTRKTSILCRHYRIDKNLQSFHQHNEHRKIDSVISLLSAGKNIALVSDAGTPAICDPGFLLVRECITNNIRVECLAGPTAFVPALVISGFSTHSFVFLGFPPMQKKRNAFFHSLGHFSQTMILYESPHRLMKTMQQIELSVGKDRNIVVCREISKIYEQTYRGTVHEVHAALRSDPLRGEFVIVIAGA